MLELAKCGPGDRLFDLGCGDGRIVIAAALRGAEGVGIDFDPERIAEAKAGAEAAGVTDRVSFHRQDLFRTDLRGATIVTLYLLPLPNRLLGHRLRTDLAPGTRVVSHAWPIEGWPADQELSVDGRTLYAWTVR